MTTTSSILLTIWLGVFTIGIAWLCLVVEKFKRRESYKLPLNTSSFIHWIYIKENGDRFEIYLPGFALWILWPVSVPTLGLILLYKHTNCSRIYNHLMAVWCFSKEERITIALGIEEKNK